MTDEIDGMVRATVAAYIRDRGQVPTIAAAAAALRTDPHALTASFERLAAAHVFIPRRGSAEIYAYNPFCADETAFSAHVDGRRFFAICGWDALGIPAALGRAGRIETSCPDCREPIVVDVAADGRASAATPVVFRVDVRARDFWNDIYFT